MCQRHLLKFRKLLYIIFFKMPRRCTVGCPPSGIPMHRFPDAVKFPERFKTWVSLIGGKLETSSDFEYYKRQRICDIHFSERHKNRNNRLSALANPMFHLPGPSQYELILEQISTFTQQLEPTVSQPSIAGQSESQVEEIIISTQRLSHSKSQTATAGPSQNKPILEKNSTSTQQLEPTVSQSAIAGTSRNIALLEHNYSVISKPRKQVRKDVTGPLRAKIKHLQTEISRLRKKGHSYKTRLENAKTLSNNAFFQQCSNYLKKPAQLFFRMQLQALKKAKGRRFSIRGVIKK